MRYAVSEVKLRFMSCQAVGHGLRCYEPRYQYLIAILLANYVFSGHSSMWQVVVAKWLLFAKMSAPFPILIDL